jgi:hypothetical protein
MTFPKIVEIKNKRYSSNFFEEEGLIQSMQPARQPARQPSPCAQFRLDVYNIFRRGNRVRWVSPYDNNEEFDSPVPSNVEDPNTYLIPLDQEQSNLFSFSLEPFTPDPEDDNDFDHNQVDRVIAKAEGAPVDLCYNWGTLHGYIEGLYHSGWTILELKFE